MPFIRTTTNVNVTKQAAEQIKAAYGKNIELISGKAECYLMLSISGNVDKILGIPESRIYVNYLEYERWGVDGHNV